jgi:hypothetical protein
MDSPNQEGNDKIRNNTHGKKKTANRAMQTSRKEKWGMKMNK